MILEDMVLVKVISRMKGNRMVTVMPYVPVGTYRTVRIISGLMSLARTVPYGTVPVYRTETELTV